MLVNPKAPVCRNNREVSLIKRSLLLTLALCPIFYIPFSGNSISFIDMMSPILALLILICYKRVFFNYFFLYFLFVLFLFLFSGLLAVERSIVSAGLALRLFFIAAPMALVFCLARGNSSFIFRALRYALYALLVATTAGLALHNLGIVVDDNLQKLWVGQGFGPTYRAGGLIGNSGAYGSTSALLVCISIGLRLVKQISQPVAILGVCMGLLALWAASSRSGIAIVLIFSIGIYIFAVSRRPILITVVPAFAAVAITFFQFLSTHNLSMPARFTLYRLDFLGLFEESRFFQTERFTSWQSLLDIMWDTPVFGIGYKMSLEELGFYIDNSFLIAWFEGGPIVFFLFVAFWIVSGSVLARNFFRYRCIYSWIAICFYLSFLFRNLTGGAITLWDSAPLFFFFIAAFQYLSESKHKSPPAHQQLKLIRDRT